jgi:hypothetical protein
LFPVPESQEKTLHPPNFGFRDSPIYCKVMIFFYDKFAEYNKQDNMLVYLIFYLKKKTKKSNGT